MECWRPACDGWGSGACCWVVGYHACVVACAVLCCVCAWCGVRVVVENCIVDASIFIVVCVCATWCCAKLCSAIGGCLGTKSR